MANNKYNGLRCVECDEPLDGRKKKYCSKACNRRFHNRKRYEKQETWTPKVEALVIASLQNGLTIEQACRQADIGTTSFYDRQSSDSEFAEKIKAAREFTEVEARKALTRAIREGDMQTVRWFLSRKAKQEFSERHELSDSEGKSLTDNMTEEKFNALLERAVGKAQPSGEGKPVSGQHREDAADKPAS